MKWLDSMNDAVEYLEKNIMTQIDLIKVAEIACCSLHRFQRLFLFTTDITLTEYIRYRRMSLAADELLNSKSKIIEIADKYGYSSPESFTRAYSSFHGISPSSTRKTGFHTKYPRISFEITINGGNFNMGRKPVVQIEEHNDRKVASFFVDCPGPETKAWNLLREWATKNLTDYNARRYIGIAPKGHHPEGESHDPNEGPIRHEYAAQMFLFDDEGMNDEFHGAEVCDAPKGLYLVGDIVLNEYDDNGDIDIGTSMQKAYGVMSECLKEMDSYEFAMNERRYYEEHIFSPEWFNGSADLAEFKLWLPIRKKQA